MQTEISSLPPTDRSTLRPPDKPLLQPKEQASKARPSSSKPPADTHSSYRNNLQASVETSEIASTLNGVEDPSKEASSKQFTTTQDDHPLNGLHQFQIDFIRNMIEDAIEDTRFVCFCLYVYLFVISISCCLLNSLFMHQATSITLALQSRTFSLRSLFIKCIILFERKWQVFARFQAAFNFMNKE